MISPPDASPAKNLGSSQRLASVWLAAALAFTPGAGLAQNLGPQATPDCVPAPLDGGDEGTYPDAAPDTDLTEKLDACDGVLKPPKVGDCEIVEPAPAVGNTPVIEPEDLPGQQPP